MDSPTPNLLAAIMKRDADILIVGGGLIGPLLSVALAQAGLTSIVFDAQERAVHADPGFDGRAYAISFSSRRLLEALGLWSGLSGNAEQIRGMRISDGLPRTGTRSPVLEFDNGELDVGPMGHFLEDRYVRAALIAAMDSDPLIDHRAGTVVRAHEAGPGGVVITLADGAHLSGSVVVGCDGRGSDVARRAGITRTGWDYRQTGLVCAVEHDKPHCGIARQFFYPGGPFAILPLPGNRSSVVWSEERRRAEVISELGPAAYLREVKHRFGDSLGELRLAGARYSYPLGLSLATSFSAERLALCGDAAHGIHPLAGQGLNLGFRDVAALAQVLADAHRRGEDPGSAGVLQQFAQWRRVDTALLSVSTDSINRLFSNANPLLRTARVLGLGLVSQSTTLRRFLIQEAAGVAGDLPRLLQGRRV